MTEWHPCAVAYGYDPVILWGGVVADILIWAAYMAIPLALHRAGAAFRRQLSARARHMLWLFVAFIAACGSTHLLEAATAFRPVFDVELGVKVLTAAVSVTTAILLVAWLPALLRDEVDRRVRVEVDRITHKGMTVVR